MNLFFFIVPSASPANLTAIKIASNCVALKWTALNKEDQNGIILSYIIQYSRFSTGNVSSIQAYITEMVVDDLLPHVVYSFSIAARTIVGIGPFSTHLQVTTAEAGEYISIVHIMKVLDRLLSLSQHPPAPLLE